MRYSAPSLLALAAGALGVCALQVSVFPAAVSAASSTSAAPAVTGKRWAKIDLTTADDSGEIQIGKPLELSTAIGGVAQGGAPLVAICESVLFERQVVTLEPDETPQVLKGSATLEPIPSGKLSVIPKAARVQVTFARLREGKFERVLTRVVYITLGAAGVPDMAEPSAPIREKTGGGELMPDEEQPDVVPVSGGQVAEEDLLPLPAPDQGRAYWQQISSLVSRSWSRAVRHVRHAPASETVRVRFRLYPSGRAQLIQIEKGSGAREVDEAGIYTIVQAQPFPPFPSEAGSEAVDVHVRMRTGAKASSREVQSVTIHSSSSSEAGSGNAKK